MNSLGQVLELICVLLPIDDHRLQLLVKLPRSLPHRTELPLDTTNNNGNLLETLSSALVITYIPPKLAITLLNILNLGVKLIGFVCQLLESVRINVSSGNDLLHVNELRPQTIESVAIFV